MLQFDRVGFPMVYIEPLGVYTNFLPITKIQFEYFMCDPTSGRTFDESWYTRATDPNVRQSPADINRDNYWNALMTGVGIDDCQMFAQWFVTDDAQMCYLPDDEQWKAMYEYCDGQNPLEIGEFTGHTELNVRARQLLERLNAIAKQPSRGSGAHLRGGGTSASHTTLADQMLMCNGVYEWVKAAEGWGGRGQPPASIGGGGMKPNRGAARMPRENVAQPYFGFRLVCDQ